MAFFEVSAGKNLPLKGICFLGVKILGGDSKIKERKQWKKEKALDPILDS